MEKFSVISYYKYVNIKDPKKFQEKHLELCKSFGLKGRIYIGNEGINGTVSGIKEDIERYKRLLRSNKSFNDIEFKEQECNEHVFRKMFVRVRKEIVNFSEKVDFSKSGLKISPKKFKEMIENEKDFVILDVRNNYETKIGRFKGAITLDIENFRDFPKIVNKIKHLKHKKIITYCTGGVRCEKASAFLRENGFKEVYQLEGGILNYSKEVPNSYFNGRCFVFDERMSIPINTDEYYAVISNCEICGISCDRIIDCCNNDCNRIFVCCEKCEKKMKSGCSEYCAMHPTRRKWLSYKG